MGGNFDMEVFEIPLKDGRVLNIRSEQKVPPRHIIQKALAKLPEGVEPDEYFVIPNADGSVAEQPNIDYSQLPNAPGPSALNTIAKIAPYAGMAFRTTPMGMLGAAGLTGASRFVEGTTGGESKLEALKNAAIAAGIDLGTLGLGKGLGKLIQTGPVSNVLGQTGEMLSSVPQKSITKAIQDPSILKRTETFEDVGESARKGLGKLQDDQWKRTIKEEALLDTESDFVKSNTLPFKWLKKYDGLLKKMGGREKELSKVLGKTPKYTELEKKQVRKFINDVKSDNTPAGLNEVVGRIDESVKWTPDNNPSDRVQKLLKEIRKDVSKTIKDDFDKENVYKSINWGKEYDKLRAMSSDFLGGVQSPLGGKLTTRKDASKLFKRKQEEPIRKALEKFDELYPEGRLLDRAQNIQAQDQFSRIFAGQGGGSGSAQGAANIARILLGTAAPVLLPLMSPVGQRETIKHSPKAMQALAKLLAGSAGFTPIQPKPDGSISKDTVLRTRGGN